MHSSQAPAQVTFFSKFPDDIKKLILAYAFYMGLGAFRLVCREFNLWGRRVALVDRLLLAVMRDERLIIARILQESPGLLMEKGAAKTATGKVIHSTPLEYVMRVGHGSLADLLLAQLATLSQSEILKVTSQFLENHAAKKIKPEKPEYHELYTEYLNRCLSQDPNWPAEERIALLKKINASDSNRERAERRNCCLQYIFNFSDLSDNEKEAKRTLIRRSNLCDQDGFDIIPLMEAYSRYLRHIGRWDTAKLRSFLCEVIGFFQLELPKHYIERLSDDTSSPPTLKLHDDGKRVSFEATAPSLGKDKALARKSGELNVISQSTFAHFVKLGSELPTQDETNRDISTLLETYQYSQFDSQAMLEKIEFMHGLALEAMQKENDTSMTSSRQIHCNQLPATSTLGLLKKT